MRASLRDLFRYAKTGIPHHGMRSFDKMLSKQIAGSGSMPVATLIGISPFDFLSDGTPLTAWIINGASGGVGDKTHNIVQIADDNYVAYGSYTDFTVNNNEITSSGNTLVGFLAKVDGGSDYSISMRMSSGQMRIREYGAKPAAFGDDSFIVQSVNDQSGSTYKSATFTTQSETEWLHVCWYAANVARCYDVMLNAGSTAMDYEPFGYVIPISCNGITHTIYRDSQLAEGDSVGMEDTGITITPASGSNTFSVGTTLAPSSVSITGHIQAAT